MTGSEQKKNLQNNIDEFLKGLGYTYQKKIFQFVKKLRGCEVRISCDITSGGYPKNIIAMNVLAFVDLWRVNEIGSHLFSPPAVNPATLWGSIRAFTPANNSHDTGYYFDVLKDNRINFDRLNKDLQCFDAFASTLTDIHMLSNKRLGKTPRIWKNFDGGLSWDYKYGCPQNMAIIHVLNGEFDDARDCAVHANHLSANEKEALLDFIELHSSLKE